MAKLKKHNSFSGPVPHYLQELQNFFHFYGRGYGCDSFIPMRKVSGTVRMLAGVETRGITR